MVITLITTLFLVYRFHIIFNIQDSIRVLPNTGIVENKIFENYEINKQLYVYSNLQYVIKGFTVSTIYISFLTFILMKYWICKNNKIKGAGIIEPITQMK